LAGTKNLPNSKVDPKQFLREGKSIPSDLAKLANLIESDIMVTSGYRDPVYNASLPGASKTSRHIKGIAVDIQIMKFAKKNGGTGNNSSRRGGKNYYHSKEAHATLFPMIKKAVDELGFGGVHLYGYFIHLDKGALQCGAGGGVRPNNHGNRELGAYMRRKGFTSKNLTQADSIYDEMGYFVKKKS
jgi:hypothetical protein